MARSCKINFGLRLLLFVVLIGFSISLKATEPNESFATATVLSPGMLSVTDNLTPALFPDTIVGARALIGGNVYVYDDDGSPLGNGRASALYGISTNNGSIDFSITGFPDEAFEGGHGEIGDYEVFVDVYDFFGDPVHSFSEIHTLQPGQVDNFMFFREDYIGGTYDVYLDNTLGGVPGDIDFFTFTGLTPGASFTAETFQTSAFQIDTILGWFDASGTLTASDDDGGSGGLSLLQGTVPIEGKLTFAVTGYPDNDFLGNHSEDSDYELRLTVGVPGDFDGDGDVDGRDFLVWQPNPMVGNLADWQANYGTGNLLTAASIAVPEPASLSLVATIACTWAAFFFWRRSS